MLKPFTLLNPTNIAECLDMLLNNKNAKLVAGGTDVFVEMHKGFAYPLLIDLKSISGLNQITFDQENGLIIGALATLTDIVNNSDIVKYYPALRTGALSVGSIQVRNKGTLVGNICNASPAADTAGPLLLYDAIVQIESKGGKREVPISEFFIGPKKTVLKQSEIVTSVKLVPPLKNSGSSYLKLKKRGAMEIGIMSAGARLALNEKGQCTFARITMSAVNPTPIRVTKAEEYLIGTEVSKETIAVVAEIAWEVAEPMTWRNSEEWSKDMVKVYVPDAIEEAAMKSKDKGEY